MAPNKWDDEEEDTSSEEESPTSSPPIIAKRNKFDDEEDEDDVLDSWDAAEDSEVEREKAKKAAEAKAKAEAEAKANHKTKSQRIEEKRQENLRRRQAEEEDDSEEEDDAERRRRLLQQEKDADLKNAEDLFGDLAVNQRRGPKPVTLQDSSDPTNAINLSALPLFDPTSKEQFQKLRETLVPLLTANTKKPHYVLFLQEFAKQISKDLRSDDIKKIASGLTTLSNEKMKEEKASEKGGKKTKAAKTKTTLNAARDVSLKADTAAYDDDLGDDDFM